MKNREKIIGDIFGSIYIGIGAGVFIHELIRQSSELLGPGVFAALIACAGVTLIRVMQEGSPKQEISDQTDSD